MASDPVLNLGLWKAIGGKEGGAWLRIPARHFTTHGVMVGMTGSGKTGLVTVMVEEALRAGIPTLVIDVKGDLPNLLLSFPHFDPSELAPWVESDTTPELLAKLGENRKEALARSCSACSDATRMLPRARSTCC